MKTSGFRCETKFGLLVFLGHPNVHHMYNVPHVHHNHHLLHLHILYHVHHMHQVNHSLICTIFISAKLTAAHKALRAQERSEGGVRIQFSASPLEGLVNS